MNKLLPAAVRWARMHRQEQPNVGILVDEIDRLSDRAHSEEFVVMFLGFLNGDTPELHAIESPRLLDSWDKFKREMGKRK